MPLLKENHVKFQDDSYLIKLDSKGYCDRIINHYQIRSTGHIC